MRGLRHAAALLVILALACGAAAANPISDPLGEGPAALAIVPYVLIEVCIALAEALAYWRLARMEWPLALCTALIANAASALVGIGLNSLRPGLFPTEPSAGSVLLGLAIGLAVELPIVVGMAKLLSSRWQRFPERARPGVRLRPALTLGRLLLTGLAANIVTYLVAEGVIGFTRAASMAV